MRLPAPGQPGYSEAESVILAAVGVLSARFYRDSNPDEAHVEDDVEMREDGLAEALHVYGLAVAPAPPVDDAVKF